MTRTVYRKKIRDPILGDIGLHKAELRVIDTQQFQRLRGIKQLGLAYLVYPSAVHTRFEHALGTLWMAQRIVEGINLNAAKEREDPANGEPRVGDQELEIIRLAALLHDISHAPFGHTIEDDLKLRERHDDPVRVNQALDDQGEIGSILKDLQRLDHVRRILTAKDEKTVKELASHDLKPSLAPYMADIISNTICADLLDYVRRDTYFSGIRFAFDDRLFDHFEIDKQNRLAIRSVLRNRYRTAVMSEILNTLRARYTLAERLIFHHANQAAVAMLGRALIEKPQIGLEVIGGETDFEFLSRLERDGGKVASWLVGKIRRRDFHKQVFMITRAEAEAHGGAAKIVKAYGGNPAARLHLGSTVEDQLHLDRGSVIIHCPAEDMSLKEASVRVLLRGTDVQVLVQIERDPPSGEVSSLTEKYRALWAFQAFLTAEHRELKAEEVSDLLERELRHHNELYEGEPWWDNLGMLEEAYERVAKNMGLDLQGLNRIKLSSYSKMRERIQNAGESGDPISVEALAEAIREAV